jgi:hypothetical protein
MKRQPFWALAVGVLSAVVWLFALGGVAIWMGLGELETYRASSAVPTPIRLDDIESGSPIYNHNVVLGPHFLLFDLAVFRYHGGIGGEEPGPDVRVDETYVPAVSESHPFIEHLRALETRYGSLAAVPESVPFPEVGSYALIVRTKSFRTVGAIPRGIVHRGETSGLIVNRIDPLTSDERELLVEANPDVDIESVLILDVGRKLRPPGVSYAFIAGGSALCLLAVYRCVRLVQAHRQRESPYRLPSGPAA